MRLPLIAFLLPAFLLAASSTRATPIPLFDGSLGTTPDAQGWLYLTSPLIGATSTRQASGNGTRLVSPVAEQAGWFSTLHPSMPVLPVGAAIDLDFGLQLLSETHASDNRAGFSLILLNQASRGIELAFWNDRVWAQNDQPLFTHGEEALFDTTRLTDYQLRFRADGYELRADGNALLTGALRDYSAHSNPVYSSASFLFFGDDTSSAGSDSLLQQVRIEVATVPTPGLPALLGIGLLGLRWRTGESTGTGAV